MFDQTLDTTERCCTREHIASFDNTQRLFFTAFDLNRQHAAESAVHLPPGDLMTWMARQARINDRIEFGMTLEMFCNCQRGFACFPDAQTIG